MLRALRNIIGPVILMAALGGCGDMNTASFLNDSTRPASTKIQFRNGISYPAPRGFCVHDQETYQDETKGFGVFATCSGAYKRSRLLTVAHYPIDPDHKVELENLVQAAGLGAKVLKVVEKGWGDLCPIARRSYGSGSAAKIQQNDCAEERICDYGKPVRTRTCQQC